jgi:hypothetical protein
MIGVIRRTFAYLDLKTFRMLYVSLVRPHLEYVNPVWNPYLEYVNPVWNPYLKKHIDMIENIKDSLLSIVTPTSFSAIVSSIGFKSALRVYSCFFNL